MESPLGGPGRPLLSVIVPVSDGQGHLGACLDALLASDLPREAWELVVVDDGSLDRSSAIAGARADLLVRVPGPPHGPAYARNRGVDASLAPILLFVDADVAVHADTLRRILWDFAGQPDLGAVFGSYDADPPEPDDVSQYRNLRQHYVHQRAAGPTGTFWAACGAVRRDAFAQAGQFDEWHFPRPQIEDVELGYRLRGLGYRMLLDPAVQGTPLRRWTFRQAVIADVRDRCVPWVRLHLALGSAERPASLFFSKREWLNSALVGAAALLLVLDLRLRRTAVGYLALALLLVVVASNLGLYRFFRRRRGLRFAIRIIPIHLFYYFSNGLAAVWAWGAHHLVGPPGPPAEVQAYVEKGLKAWPPQPQRLERGAWRARGSSPGA
ncbi:MAG TPA: glycosyltransferase [Gemmatimonadales bacterium]|nr:glycosyltransferase [Gemmatimonadales bacterium]